MNKKIVYALVLIGLTVMVLLMNHGQSVEIRLWRGVSPDMRASFAYLLFTGLGVSIGALLK